MVVREKQLYKSAPSVLVASHHCGVNAYELDPQESFCWCLPSWCECGVSALVQALKSFHLHSLQWALQLRATLLWQIVTQGAKLFWVRKRTRWISTAGGVNVAKCTLDVQYLCALASVYLQNACVTLWTDTCCRLYWQNILLSSVSNCVTSKWFNNNEDIGLSI